ncbi:MAG TPA: DUF1192 domain-containing protein [Geminicoccus sp.]|uniref:DUF1192 domain-containing protein n=1 Tax=Geminicoccus sp. TaxID=2024832 RepID=UPI002B7C113D|nr:DUF1192 domain-containing protein [Geminicoccus sp.]HWL69074.1 DUF1192 domain-containing protein [Geminicoccus sp.]
MQDDDEPRFRRTQDLTVPGDLARLSVEEMTRLRDRLKVEVGRLDAEIARRDDVRRAADALFKKPAG